MFSLAHLSDVHLAPLPQPGVGELLSKRAIGFMSWHLRRKNIHSALITNRIVADIKAQNPDHIAFTGDLLNIALAGEFTRGIQWLEEFGPGDRISFVPGNHDAYVHVDWAAGIGRWSPYMASDLSLVAPEAMDRTRPGFPYVRQRRNVALIGVSTGVPAALHRASGTVGTAQLSALAPTLELLHARGFCRVVMIHHPPLPGQCVPRRGLDDAPALAEVLKESGAEFVLHGHNHTHMYQELQTRTGKAHILGVPSASAAPGGHKPAAAWYHYRIKRQQGAWCADVTVRAFDGTQNIFLPEREFSLAAG
jgi:3',5'-cyclic AMP phosphodiesterase CpdA